MTVQFWRNGRPTAAAVETYTEGDCWMLAYAIHRQTGWPIYSIAGGEHFVVRTPDRLYLDVEGISTLDELASRWATRPWDIREAGTMDFWPDFWDYITKDYHEGMETFEGGFRRAPLMARRLIDYWKAREAA